MTLTLDQFKQLDAQQRPKEFKLELELYNVAVKVEEYCVRFEIADNDKQVELVGHIKWDGCSNWKEPNGIYHHVCGLGNLKNLYDLIVILYGVAKQYLGEECE